MGIDPRKGLRPNLDLLSAYKIYEQDYPVFKPDISATLAMNSPLYKRIQDTLTDQSQLKAEHDADEARIRNAAITANVPLEPMRQMMAALLQEARPPAPAHEAASSSLNTAHMQVDNAQGGATNGASSANPNRPTATQTSPNHRRCRRSRFESDVCHALPRSTPRTSRRA